MTIYGYKCPMCGQTYESTRRQDRLAEVCHVCGGHPLHRDFSGISITPPMQEHWNQTVDQPISSQRQFNDALARQGERLSEYTQVEQDLQPVDPEQARLGVTEEGLDSTNRQRVAQGMKPIRLSQL